MTKQEDISRIWPSILHIETARLGKLTASGDSQFFIQTSPIVENSLAELKSEALSHPSSKFWTPGTGAAMDFKVPQNRVVWYALWCQQDAIPGIEWTLQCLPTWLETSCLPSIFLQPFSWLGGGQGPPPQLTLCPAMAPAIWLTLARPSLQPRYPLRTWRCR